MNREAIGGMIIMVLVCWGCGGLFFGIGCWSVRRRSPMHFWAGTQLDPKTISDIPAYNRENGTMWKLYSVPFWLAGVFSLGVGWEPMVSIASLVLMLLASTVGLWWLVRRYKHIEAKYRVQP